MQRRSLLATAAALAMPDAAGAQSWPSRPVRIVVPDAPGAGNDSTARVFSHHLEQALGQAVPVDNRPGAGGRIGVEHVFRSPPDGSTLLLGNAGSNGINAALYRDLPYDLERDFVPVSLLVAGPNALVVNPRIFPVDTVAELITAIRARPPGHYNYATAGAGSSAHFSSELFKAMTGLDLVHVPFRGAAGMAQAVISGDAPFLIANLVNVLPFVRRGEVRLLAVTSLERWPDTPEVPTLHESGLAGFETLAWNGLFGPPGLPAAIVGRLLPELQRIGRLPDVVERIRLLGGRIVTSPPEVLAGRVRADIAKWRDLAARAGIRIELMIIDGIAFLGLNVTPKTNWCFLEVRTKEGLTGLGECTLANQEALLEAEAARLGARVAGADARDRNRLARLLPHAPGGLVAATVLSAFEAALLDLAGQRAGEPLHRVLGGALRQEVRLYANINRGADPRTPEGFAAAARRAVAEGFRGVKLAPFEPLVWEDGATEENRRAYAEGLARIAAVREAIGAEADLMVDAHWRFSPGGAAALVRDVAPLGLHWLECPVAEANHREIRRLRGMANDRGMRLAGAETLSGLAAYRPLIEGGLYDVIMPDAKHAGGLEEIRRIAALALTAGVEVAPHNPTGPVCHAHSVHLCATIPNFLVLEVQFGETAAFFDMVEGESLRFVDGAARLPTAPGLGLRLRRPLPPGWVRMDRPWLDPRLG